MRVKRLTRTDFHGFDAQTRTGVYLALGKHFEAEHRYSTKRDARGGMHALHRAASAVPCRRTPNRQPTHMDPFDATGAALGLRPPSRLTSSIPERANDDTGRYRPHL
jgi:hypothetical protein